MLNFVELRIFNTNRDAYYMSIRCTLSIAFKCDNFCTCGFLREATRTSCNQHGLRALSNPPQYQYKIKETRRQFKSFESNTDAYEKFDQTVL